MRLHADHLRADLNDLAEMSVPVDLHDRVLAASKRARARTAIVTSGAVSLVMLVAGGLALAYPGGGGTQPPAQPGQPTTLPTGTLPEEDPAFAPYDAGPLAHATLDVPAWPGEPDCRAGTLAFVRDGVAHLPSRPFHRINIVKVIAVAAPADGSTEYVALLRCAVTGSTPRFADQVFTVSVPPGATSARTLGSVVATGTGGIAGIFDIAFDNGMIRVDVGDRTGASAGTALRQLRYYQRDGTRYVQVSGATSFPDNPPAVALTVALSHTAAPEVDGRRLVDVEVTVANSGTIASRPLRLIFAVPATAGPAGTGWTGCIRDESNLDERQLLLVCPLDPAPAGGAVVAAYQLLVPLLAPVGGSEIQIAAVAVEQTSPRALERDLADNQGSFVVS
jgi:hypothetical protein